MPVLLIIIHRDESRLAPMDVYHLIGSLTFQTTLTCNRRGVLYNFRKHLRYRLIHRRRVIQGNQRPPAEFKLGQIVVCGDNTE